MQLKKIAPNQISEQNKRRSVWNRFKNATAVIGIAALLACGACIHKPTQPLAEYKKLDQATCENFNTENNALLNRLLSRWDPVMRKEVKIFAYYKEAGTGTSVALSDTTTIMLRMTRRGVESIDHEMGHFIFNLIMERAPEDRKKDIYDLCHHLAALNQPAYEFIRGYYLSSKRMQTNPELYVNGEIFASAVAAFMDGRKKEGEVDFVLDRYSISYLKEFKLDGKKIFLEASRYAESKVPYERGPYIWNVNEIKCYVIDSDLLWK
jgi:hypothetical protein